MDITTRRNTVFTYSSRGFPWFSRTTRPRHSVKGKYTPRSSRSRLNRSRTHTARRSFLEWQICLALSALSPYSTRREGHEARRRARLTWPSFLPSLLHERLSYASPESGAATTPRSPPTFQPVHRGTPRDLTLTINADENSNNNNNKLIAMEIDQVWWTS